MNKALGLGMLIKNLTGRLCEVSDSCLILSNNAVIASHAIQIVYEVRIHQVSGQKCVIDYANLEVH
ncbi:hypothetical protein VCHA53O473_130118 [Vibrio chagasii]|nr:hypothetical protein VCHA53O473_130118 [Vibrio chagasii]CAH7189606.1 hypothetical protein VCHA43P275_20325 [Vibrio chagasii]